MSVRDGFQLLQTFGLPLAMLTIVLFTGARKVWVWGYQLADRDKQLVEKDKEIDRERARGDWWQQRNLDQSAMIDRSIDLANRGLQLHRSA